MNTQFQRAEHTIVLSDMHITEAEPVHPGNPLWKRYKRPKLFIDRTFSRLMELLRERTKPGSSELILNGDIFDFDSVLSIPPDPPFRVSWLERKRGLLSEEQKSVFKMQTILEHHPVWVEALRNWVLANNRLIFVIGNHDMELHWPSVQQAVINRLDLPEELRENVRFCEWFYISNGDTLIEHGNQYDSYSLCSNPIHPLIKKGSRIYVRLPFGNLAGKFMVNGMGLFNPHIEASFIKDSLKEYLVFFFKYMVRVQPLIVWTWFWGAMVTLVYSVSEGFLPALKDPLMVETRVEDIARKANTTPSVVRGLRELHTHPAYMNPFKLARELWLDRAILLGLILLGCFWFFTTLHVFVQASIWWFIIPTALLMPMFIFYAKSIESEVSEMMKEARRNLPLSAQIAKVRRAIHGHTHIETHTWVENIELLNTGNWSPAFYDPECTQPFGRKCFAWVHGEAGSEGRVAGLFEWVDGETPEIRHIAPESAPPSAREKRPEKPAVSEAAEVESV